LALNRKFIMYTNKRRVQYIEKDIALNAICPYFTMFPLQFPLDILKRRAVRNDIVLDPFAGRGTTLYAARLCGLQAHGIDSNPVATAISEAKLANTSPKRIVAAANRILADVDKPRHVPIGEFWERAFHKEVLHKLCRFREGLMANCESHTRKALRALILGALHGPLGKQRQTYFSNQCPRTYAPKPKYATKFWRKHRLHAPHVDVLLLIEQRAERYFGEEQNPASGLVITGDSQDRANFSDLKNVSWILTSPPYYGMRTYIPDQWLRLWFVGGTDEVDYSNVGQLSHTNKDVFRDGLRRVWNNCAIVAKNGCHMVIRFGAINDRKVSTLALVKDSLRNTRWRLRACISAGNASSGKRQADHFVSTPAPENEYDVWAELV
jgi:DNA modification methylase